MKILAFIIGGIGIVIGLLLLPLPKHTTLYDVYTADYYLTKSTGIKHTLTIVESERINARIIMNPSYTHIYINTGLIEAMEPDEVASVLAHELGHYKTVVLKDKRALYTLIGYGIKDIDVDIAREMEADLEGAMIMMEAGYNPFASLYAFDSWPNKWPAALERMSALNLYLRDSRLIYKLGV